MLLAFLMALSQTSYIELPAAVLQEGSAHGILRSLGGARHERGHVPKGWTVCHRPLHLATPAQGLAFSSQVLLEWSCSFGCPSLHPAWHQNQVQLVPMGIWCGPFCSDFPWHAFSDMPVCCIAEYEYNALMLIWGRGTGRSTAMLFSSACSVLDHQTNCDSMHAGKLVSCIFCSRWSTCKNWISQRGRLQISQERRVRCLGVFPALQRFSQIRIPKDASRPWR